MIYHILYTSKAEKPFDEFMMSDLLNVSRKNNSENEVSGMLLYREGIFLQLLEGEEQHVKELYKKIEADSRHKDTLLLAELQSEERVFGDWTMAYRDLDEFHPDKRSELVDKMDEIVAFNGELTQDAVFELLKHFRFLWN